MPRNHQNSTKFSANFSEILIFNEKYDFLSTRFSTRITNCSFGSSGSAWKSGWFGQTHNASSGTDSVLNISPTYNQSGTAGGTDLLVNRTETAIGSGDQNLMDLQVGGTSKFKVDNAGNAVMSGVVNQMTSSAALPSTTEFPNDQDWGIHHDTANDHIYLAFNKSGSIKKTLIN